MNKSCSIRSRLLAGDIGDALQSLRQLKESGLRASQLSSSQLVQIPAKSDSGLDPAVLRLGNLQILQQTAQACQSVYLRQLIEEISRLASNPDARPDLQRLESLMRHVEACGPATLGASQRMNAALKKENEELQGSVTLRQQELEDVARGQAAFEAELNKAHAELAAEKTENARLRAEHVRATSELDASTRQFSQEKSLTEELRQQLHAAQLDALRCAGDGALKTQELEREVAAQRNTALVLRSKIAKLETELQAETARAKEADRISFELNGVLEQLQTTNETIRAAESRAKQMEIKNEELQARLAQTEAQLSESQDKIDNRVAAELNEMRTALTSERLQLCAEQEHVQALTVENSSLSSERVVLLEKINRLETAAAEIRNMANSSDEAINSFKEQEQATGAALQRASEQTNQLKQELAAATLALDVERSRAQELQEQVERLTSDRAGFERARKEAEDANTLKIQTLERELASAIEKQLAVGTRESETALLQAMLKEAEAVRDTLVKENQLLQEATNTIQAQLDVVEQKLHVAETNLCSAQATAATQEQKIIVLTTALQAAEERVSQGNKQQAATLALLDAQTAKSQQLGEELEAARQNLARQMQDAMELVKSNDLVNETITSMQGEVAAARQLEQENKELTKQSCELKAAVEQLERDVADNITKLRQMEEAQNNRSKEELALALKQIENGKAEAKALRARIVELTIKSTPPAMVSAEVQADNRAEEERVQKNLEELERCRQAGKDAEAQCQQAQLNVQALTQQLADATQRIAALENENASAASQSAQPEKKAGKKAEADMRQQIKELQAQLQSMKEPKKASKDKAAAAAVKQLAKETTECVASTRQCVQKYNKEFQGEFIGFKKQLDKLDDYCRQIPEETFGAAKQLAFYKQICLADNSKASFIRFYSQRRTPVFDTFIEQKDLEQARTGIVKSLKTKKLLNKSFIESVLKLVTFLDKIFTNPKLEEDFGFPALTEQEQLVCSRNFVRFNYNKAMELYIQSLVQEQMPEISALFPTYRENYQTQFFNLSTCIMFFLLDGFRPGTDARPIQGKTIVFPMFVNGDRISNALQVDDQELVGDVEK